VRIQSQAAIVENLKCQGANEHEARISRARGAPGVRADGDPARHVWLRVGQADLNVRSRDERLPGLWRERRRGLQRRLKGGRRECALACLGEHDRWVCRF
jgi:hypothetical protein